MKLLFSLLMVLGLCSCEDKRVAALQSRIDDLEAQLTELKKESKLTAARLENTDMAHQSTQKSVTEIVSILKFSDEHVREFIPKIESLCLASVDKCHESIIEIAKIFAGTPQESFGKDRARFWVKKLMVFGGYTEAQGLLLVDDYFKSAAKSKAKPSGFQPLSKSSESAP